MQNAILITGGAGYIGSHIIEKLQHINQPIITIDNLSTGYAKAILHGELIIGDCGDEKLLAEIFSRYSISTVIHLAAHTIVPESVANPGKYYANNTINTFNLINACIKAGVKYFIFSSSAAVYGISEKTSVTEEDICQPINPYGRSKLMCEYMLEDFSQAHDFTYVSLRYFNVGGADPAGNIGHYNPAATTLIKVAAQAAVGLRDRVEIFGDDYQTPDGTGVRDYIHVSDLALAHIEALNYLHAGNPSTILNCGYGHGFSVREVLQAAQKISGHPFLIKVQPRRAGDPNIIIADTKKIRATLKGWQPQFTDLNKIIETALNWEKKLLAQNR